MFCENLLLPWRKLTAITFRQAGVLAVSGRLANYLADSTKSLNFHGLDMTETFSCYKTDFFGF